MRYGVALLTLLALGACGRAEPDGATLNVASQRGGTKAVMLASGALDGAPYKVEWSEFPAAQPLLEALGSGAVDLGLVGDAPFLFAYQSGSRIRAIGAQDPQQRSAGALVVLVPAGSTARSILDLKGKTVATTRGSVGHHLVLRALAAAKLPPAWVRFTFLSPGDAKAAFSSGAVDAWATWAPYVLPALKEHARILIDGRELMHTYGFDVAYEGAIADKRALLADFLVREGRALAWARAHPAAYAAVLARETGLPPEVAEDFARKNGRLATPIDAAVIADQERVLEDFKQAGDVRGDRDVAAGFVKDFASNKVAATQ